MAQEPQGKFFDRVKSLDLYSLLEVEPGVEEKVLKKAVKEHHRETQSAFAERMLNHWETEIEKFWQVIPTEMIHRYERPVFAEAEAEQRA